MNDTYYDEVVRIDGRDYRVRKSYDYDCGKPWEESDMHGPVREVRGRNERGYVDKRAGEVELFCDGRRTGTTWLYDVAEATKIAKRDSWGCPLTDEEMLTIGLTMNVRERARRAVEADVEALTMFLTGEWWWCVCSAAFESDFQREGEACEWDHLGGVEDSRYGRFSLYADPEQPNNVFIEQLIPNLINENRKAWRKALRQARVERAFAQADRMLECAS